MKNERLMTILWCIMLILSFFIMSGVELVLFCMACIVILIDQNNIKYLRNQCKV